MSVSSGRKSPSPRMNGLNQQSMGYMSVPSGTYGPGKITTQCLVRDNMNAHYKKLSKVKSSVDSGPPKALATSQKVRDRNRREALKRATSRQGSANSSARASPRTPVNDDYGVTDPYYDHSQNLRPASRGPIKANHNIGVNMGNTNNMNYTSGSMNYTSGSLNYTGGSVNYNKFARGNDSMKCGSGCPPPSAVLKTQAGDILDDHCSQFTEARPHTPRTLKTDVKSRLSQTRNYNPPPKKSKAKPLFSTSSSDKGKTQASSEGDLMYASIQSRDFNRIGSHRDAGVPKLDITADPDQLNWIKDQANKAQLRSGKKKHHNLGDTWQSQPEDAQQWNGNVTTNKQNSNEGFNKSGQYVDPLTQSGEYNQLRSSGGFDSILGRTSKSRKISQTEDELKYLEFVSDVTNDVLQRGLYTNRVLKQVFNHHIEKRKGELKLSRMREFISKLREDLQIPLDDGDLDDYDLMESKTFDDIDSGKYGYHNGANGYQEESMITADDHIVEESAPKSLFSDHHMPKSDTYGGSRSSLRENENVPSRQGSRTSLRSAVHDDVRSSPLGSRASLREGDHKVGSYDDLKNEFEEKGSNFGSKSTLRDNKSPMGSRSSLRSAVRDDTEAETHAVSKTPTPQGSGVSLRDNSPSHAEEKASKNSSHPSLRDEDAPPAPKPRARVHMSEDVSFIDDDNDKLVDKMNGLKTNDDGDENDDACSVMTTDTMRSEDLKSEDKWMKDKGTFGMTLKPGQLDMTLIKTHPKPRQRSTPKKEAKELNSGSDDDF